ncbi:MAG: hypothetical protein HC820_05220 [Hydrococcus sp. RM1_1_31]|nr:hypothetical protein [Hydrococcus sp. RM1_1_31]
MYGKLITTLLTTSAIAATNISCTATSDRGNLAASVGSTSGMYQSSETPINNTVSAQPEKSNAQENERVQFICGESFDKQTNRRLPTTFAWTHRGKMALVRWKTEQFPGYPPQRRCEEVSPRFQEAYNSGTLGMITNGTMNNQPVICTTTEQDGACQNLLMTLRSQDNSLKVLKEFEDILNGRGVGPVVHSSGTPQRFVELDIQKFLNTAPVEKDYKEQ